MSERRMFSKTITESDAFLELSFSTQALYFHLALNADDEGFINNAKRVIRVCGADNSDLEELVNKAFLIKFDSGIYVIKHWKVNNRIRKDRKRETNYPDEKAQLIEKKSGIYSLRTAANESEDVAGDTETFAEHYDCLPESEAITTEEVDERIESVKKFEYEATTDARKGYAEAIYDILYEHDLPCANKNLISFQMRDFKLALAEIQRLNLHSDEVIQATRNYAEVVELKRKGLSWWNSEQTFNNFCSKTILRFLPGTYKVEEYLKDKNTSHNNLDDKIEL